MSIAILIGMQDPRVGRTVMNPTATCRVSVSLASPRPDDRSVYGPRGRSPWLDVDWREHQRWVLVDGQPVNTIELGSGAAIGREPAAGVRARAAPARWANWLEQLPVFAAEHRVVALDLPGFGHSPMPREQISISGYARTARRAARRARDRRGRASSATRWAASSPPSSRSPSRSASSASCWSPPPASRPTTIRGATRALPVLRRWSGSLARLQRLGGLASPTRSRAARACARRR